MSLVNYSGDAYAVDVLGDFLREGGDRTLEVSWVPLAGGQGGAGSGGAAKSAGGFSTLFSMDSPSSREHEN